MRLSHFPSVLLGVCLIACSSQCATADDEAKPVAPAKTAKPIGPAEAAKKVGKDVLVQMTVKSSSLRGEICFLNSETDFKDEKNFTLFIPADAMAKFKEAKIDDPEKHFKGKLVQATGKVVMYRDRPEIKLSGPADLKIVAEKKVEKK
jgi:DNA/RNA endonuclease YhcR with UshA esterase domain